MMPFRATARIYCIQMIWVAITTALIAFYFFLNHSDFSCTGFQLITKHIFDIVGVLLFFLMALAVGRFFLERINLMPIILLKQ